MIEARLFKKAWGVKKFVWNVCLHSIDNGLCNTRLHKGYSVCEVDHFTQVFTWLCLWLLHYPPLPPSKLLFPQHSPALDLQQQCLCVLQKILSCQNTWSRLVPPSCLLWGTDTPGTWVGSWTLPHAHQGHSRTSQIVSEIWELLIFLFLSVQRGKILQVMSS